MEDVLVVEDSVSVVGLLFIVVGPLLLVNSRRNLSNLAFAVVRMMEVRALPR